MNKTLSGMIMACFCLMFAMESASFAGIPETPAKTKEEQMKIMKTHMDEVKIKNPAKYESMLRKAGGAATDCIDCHTEVKEEKKDK